MLTYANPAAAEATMAKLRAEFERIQGLGLSAQQLAELAAYADPGGITSERTPSAALKYWATVDAEQVEDEAAEVLARLNLHGRANGPGCRIAGRATRWADSDAGDNRAGGVSGAAVPVLAELLELFDGWAEDHPEHDIAEVHILRGALRTAYESASALDSASQADIRRRSGEQVD